MATMEKKDHAYAPYAHNFDKLCDAGCTRPVPDNKTDNELRTIGWVVVDDDSYWDGKRRICAACSDEGKS